MKFNMKIKKWETKLLFISTAALIILGIATITTNMGLHTGRRVASGLSGAELDLKKVERLQEVDAIPEGFNNYGNDEDIKELIREYNTIGAERKKEILDTLETKFFREKGKALNSEVYNTHSKLITTANGTFAILGKILGLIFVVSFGNKIISLPSNKN